MTPPARRRRLAIFHAGAARAATWIAAMLICSMGAMLATTARPAETAKDLVVLGFGGSYGRAIRELVINPFERETGYKVVYDETCCTRVSAMLKSGQFLADVVIGIDNGGLQNWAKSGYLKPDDRVAQIGRQCGGPSRYIQPTILLLHRYFYVMAAHGRDTKLPRSWAEFWDTKALPGPRLFNRISPVAQLEAALLADGVKAANLYPLDLDRAFASLDRLRAHLVFGQSGADQVNMLATGVAQYGVGYSNRMYAAEHDGLSVNFTLEGGLRTEVGAAILSTARNVDGAIAFLAFHARPAVLAALADRIGLLPYCHSADPLITAADVRSIAAQKPGEHGHVEINAEYWGEHRESVGVRWIEWLVK
jgi:putative spermidine/putrescine transport system substrate-binding protein